MNVLVTGGAGFIGSHLCDALIARDHGVVCIDDLSHGSASNLVQLRHDDRFRFIRGSVERLPEILRIHPEIGVDAIVHCASKKIPRYGGARPMLLGNAHGAEAVFEVARAHRAKIVFASTADVYGKGTEVPFSEESPLTLGSPLCSRWGYAASKVYAEHLALAYAADFHLPVTILRFFGAYGPRQHLSWWGGPQRVFFDALSHGEALEIHGDGQQTRCFIFIEDLVEATVRALLNPAADGQVVNVAGDEEITILDLARKQAEISGVSAPRIRFVPYSSLPGRYEDVLRRTADTTKLRTLLGFVAETDLDAGLRRLWNWHRSREVVASTGLTGAR